MGRKYNYENLSEIAKDKGFELLTKEIQNTKTDIEIKCLKCKTIKMVKVRTLLDGTRCHNCTLDPKRYTFDYIKNYIEVESNSECKLLETEDSYNKKCRIQPMMALCKINFKCKCGNEFVQSFNAFKSNKKYTCNKCSISRHSQRLSYEEVKNHIEIESNSGCKLISKAYEGNHKPLEIQCSCGNIFHRALAEFKNGKLHKCFKCTTGRDKQCFTYDDVKSDLLNNNIILLSTEYKNKNTRVLIRYECGYECERDYANIRKSKYRCPHCIKVGYGRDTEQLRREIDKITKGEYELRSKYKTMNHKVVIFHKECNCEFKMTPHTFLDAGCRCTICNIPKGEKEIRNLLSINKIEFRQQYEFKDLKGGKGGLLKFDFAIFNNNKLKCLIEYDGEFHYSKVYEEHDFDGQVYRDSLKNEYCKSKNIKLIRIPYWEFDNIEKILKEENVI